jgi:phosphoglycolate phosphatase-like HAD superfamily hydrolase
MDHTSHPTLDLRYVIGVDSDGTVFDTMEMKHKQVFQPLAIELWGLQDVQWEYNQIAEAINLYSVHRGVNRFKGLAMAFDRLTRAHIDCREKLHGSEDLTEFLRVERVLSTESLEQFNEKKRSPFLNQVIEWSRRSDDLYAEIAAREGNPPYPQAALVLEQLFGQADIMVISSSSREMLLRDWSKAGLLQLTSRVAGQEMGSKATQLRETAGGVVPHRVLMVGDAMGDLEAARAHNMLFYPILAGAEEQSWKRFEAEARDRFFKETYAGAYERSLVDEFETSLTAHEFELPTLPKSK